MDTNIIVSNRPDIIAFGERPRDQRDKLEADGGVVPEPSRKLPADVKTQYRYIQRLIRKSKKARAAISIGDQEAIINVASSIAIQRDLFKLREDKTIDAEQRMRLSSQIIKVGADIRQGLSQLLLTPNSRARVVVTESPTSAADAFMSLLNPPK